MQYAKTIVVRNPKNVVMGIPAMAIREWGVASGDMLQVFFNDDGCLMIKPLNEGGQVVEENQRNVRPSMASAI